MGDTASFPPPSMPPVRDPHRRRRVVVACLAATVISSLRAAVNTYKKVYYDKTPYHTSVLSGVGWLEALRTGHLERIKTEL